MGLRDKIDELGAALAAHRDGKSTAKAPPLGYKNEAEYEQREIKTAQREMAEIRRDPIADRREAQAAFFEAMRDDPGLVAERVRWILNGTMGFGVMLLGVNILKRPRANHVAALAQMAGLLEWRCPEDMTRSAWKRLSSTEKARLERDVEDAIVRHLRDYPAGRVDA